MSGRSTGAAAGSVFLRRAMNTTSFLAVGYLISSATHGVTALECIMPTLSADTLRSFATVLFRAANVSPAESDRVSQSLVEANLRGHDSHGVIRVVQYLAAIGDGRLKPGAS